MEPTCIQLWATRFSEHERDLERYQTRLAESERARAARFRFAEDRTRFVIRRGWRREVIAEWMACSPEEVPLAETRDGGPYIAGRDEVRLSASSAGDWMVCAVGQDIEGLGVDIAVREAGMAWMEGMESACTTREKAVLESCPASVRQGRFLELWVRKEAALKALGTGLRTDPQRVEAVCVHRLVVHGAGDPRVLSGVMFRRDKVLGCVAVACEPGPIETVWRT